MKHDYAETLSDIADSTRASFQQTHQAREKGLALSREITRSSANTIRATHRGAFDRAGAMLEEIAGLVAQTRAILDEHPKVYYAGFVEAAVKEYAEAAATLAFARKASLPGHEELGIGAAPYLNGLAEAVGELRRYILDSLRRDDLARCDELLGVMDEVYTVLVTMDFPDAVTNGLRRTTDMVRGVLERTRGDLTLAMRQHRFERRLEAHQEALEAYEKQQSD